MPISQEQRDLLKDNGFTVTNECPLTLKDTNGNILVGTKIRLLIMSLEYLRAANKRLDALISKIKD